MNKNLSGDIPTVAIVGGGVSGALTAVQLLRNARRPLRINLLEPREQLARGIAYSTRSFEHLLNVPASNMSALPDQPEHFLNWLRQHHDSNVDGYTFVSRTVYGQYVEQLLNDAQQQSGPNISAEHFRDRAVRIIPREKGFEIVMTKHSCFNTDAIILALGNGPSDNPLPQAGDEKVVSAWSPIALENLPKQDAVILVGAGLTAIDVCLSLLENGHTGPVYVVSRHGLFPRVHLATPVPARPGLFNPDSTKTIRELFREIRRSVAHETANGGSWHSVVDSIRPRTDEIWQGLPLGEKRRFIRHLRSYWEVHRHRMPAHVHRRIEAMQSSGQLKVICGRLAGAFTDSSGEVNVRIHTLNPELETDIRAVRVVNCTGPQNDPRRSSDPLVRHIVADGIGRPDPLYLGLETGPNGALIAVDGTAWQNIFAIGPARKGTFWETTAVPEIRCQAVEVARDSQPPRKANIAKQIRAAAIHSDPLFASTPEPPRWVPPSASVRDAECVVGRFDDNPVINAFLLSIPRGVAKRIVTNPRAQNPAVARVIPRLLARQRE